MNLENKTIVGFIGTDNYDIIMYLAKIFSKLNSRVLLLDYSLNQSLTLCIPHPKDMNSQVEYIDYGGIDFTRTMKIKPNKISNYDFVFINYGLYHIEDVSYCSHLILTSDIQRHHLDLISNLVIDEEKLLQFVIKDVYDGVMTGERALKMICKGHSDKGYILYQDSIELRNRTILQEAMYPPLKKVSDSLKTYLINTVKSLCSSVTDNQIKLVMKSMERGN